MSKERVLQWTVIFCNLFVYKLQSERLLSGVDGKQGNWLVQWWRMIGIIGANAYVSVIVYGYVLCVVVS